MIDGKTRTGFEFSINEKATRDWKYMEHLKKAQSALKKKNADPLDAIDEFNWMLDFLLKKDREKLFKHIGELNDGYVPVNAVLEEWVDITNAGKLKNSQSSPG